MEFLDPKIDLGFRRIFPSPQSKPILIEFLNALVDQGKSVIQNLSRDEFELLERQTLRVEDSRNIVRRSLQQGLEQGLQQSRRDIARSLLDLLPPSVIAEKTGLSLPEVEALSQESSQSREDTPIL